MGLSNSVPETTPVKTFFQEDIQNGIPLPDYSNNPEKERNFNIMRSVFPDTVSWACHGDDLVAYTLGKKSTELSWYQIENGNIQCLGSSDIEYTSNLFSEFDNIDDIKKIILDCIANRNDCRMYRWVYEETSVEKRCEHPDIVHYNRAPYIKLLLFSGSPDVIVEDFRTYNGHLSWKSYYNKANNIIIEEAKQRKLKMERESAEQKSERRRKLIQEALHKTPASIPIYKNDDNIFPHTIVDTSIIKSDENTLKSTEMDEVIPVAVVLSEEVRLGTSEVWL